MADDLLCRESPMEFFKAQVEDALERQRIKTSEWTAYYVVNLLTTFLEARHPAARAVEEPLGTRLMRALHGDGPEQREELRRVGDASLFLVGFFSDRVRARLADVDYYISLGGSAYGRLAANDDEAFAEVFGEMAEKFVPLTDVLADISERGTVTPNRDLLRIYDRWQRSGSQRDEGLLMARGLVPARGSNRLQ